MGKIITTTIKYLNVIFCIVFIVYFFFYDKFDSAVIAFFSKERTLAFVLALIPTIFVYFDKKTQNIEDSINLLLNKQDTFTHKILTKSLDDVSSKKKKYKKLRIYAHSSKKIFEIYDDKKIEVDTCYLLLRKFTEEELADERNKDEERNIETTIKQWIDYKKNGHIKKLYLYRYNFNSTEYQVIFDEEILISGIYFPDETITSRQGVIDPIYVECNTKQCKILIKDYIKRFDKILNYYAS